MRLPSSFRYAAALAATAAFFVPAVAFAAPSVSSVSYPSPLTAGVPVTLSATVSSGIGVDFCSLYVDSADQGTMTISGTTASKSFTFPYARVYTVFVFCKDTAGTGGIGREHLRLRPIRANAGRARLWRQLRIHSAALSCTDIDDTRRRAREPHQTPVSCECGLG